MPYTTESISAFVRQQAGPPRKISITKENRILQRAQSMAGKSSLTEEDLQTIFDGEDVLLGRYKGYYLSQL